MMSHQNYLTFLQQGAVHIMQFQIPFEDLKPKSKPIFTKPVEISSFSYSSDRQYFPNRSELKQFRPELNHDFFNSKYADLNFGQERFVAKPEDYQEHLNGLINTLALLDKTEKAADFVTWRGIVTKIICTPFKPNDSWNFNIMRRGNTIYIEDEKSIKIREEKKNQKQIVASYWGHRFEHMVMSCCTASGDTPQTLEERFNEPVNTWREFGIVYKCKLGTHRLILGAEVDGLDESGSKYVELKTSRVLQDQNHYNTFYKHKLMTFWAQSFLAGIDRILIGFRSDRGVVKSIEYIDVNEIPRITRGKVNWCPESMLNFGTIFLDWLSMTMKSLPEDKVYRLSFNDARSINLSELPDYEHFISQNFTDAFYY